VRTTRPGRPSVCANSLIPGSLSVHSQGERGATHAGLRPQLDACPGLVAPAPMLHCTLGWSWLELSPLRLWAPEGLCVFVSRPCSAGHRSRRGRRCIGLPRRAIWRLQHLHVCIRIWMCGNQLVNLRLLSRTTSSRGHVASRRGRTARADRPAPFLFVMVSRSSKHPTEHRMVRLLATEAGAPGAPQTSHAFKATKTAPVSTQKSM